MDSFGLPPGLSRGADPRCGRTRAGVRRSRRLAATALIALPFAASAQGTGTPAGTSPLLWPECGPGQVEVMILGTFHFAQADDVDLLDPIRQRELEGILDRLEGWRPARVAVEFAHARQDELDAAYAEYVAGPEEDPGSRNETRQIGFRLARRLGHERVHAVDVPMNLWDDSIQVFDDRWPSSREGLRARWPLRFEESEGSRAALTLPEILRELNRDAVPGNSEMYAGFLPLVEEEVYAGALKLTPWYDRNLRIVQNLFRIADPAGGRVLLVIGAGHLRVIKQILDFTPQMCAVSALPLLDGIP